MRKMIFGIFAHPDDEAFGPSGTLYKAAQSGDEVHLILVTDGAASTNHATPGDLAHDRLAEWRESGQLIGASSMRSLDYADGSLRNELYLEIADKIIRHISSLTSEDASIDLITFEPGGISGHLDHIAVSQITTFVYLKLKHRLGDSINILKYFCLPETLAPEPNTSWLYMPKGKSLSEIDEIVDIEDVFDHKLKIMGAHKSQKADMESILASQEGIPDAKKEHFFYFK